ncbi:MAG: phage tail tape measure protein [Oscillospiraceae bacterium]
MANQTDNYTSKYKVDISDLKKGIAEANKTIKTANAEFKNATAGTDDWSKSADGLSAKIKQQQTIIDAEKKKLELLKEQLSRLNQNQESGKTIIAELTVKHQEAVKTYGESSEQAKKYAKQLTDAQAAQERNANAAEELRLKIINQDTAVKNAEAQVEKYQTALSDLQNHTETFTDKVSRQKSELDELKQKYANVAAEKGKDSEEAKNLASKIATLSGELKENRNKLSDAEQAADTFDDSLDDVSDSADEVTNGSLEAFNVALGNLASKAITFVINKLKDMVSAVKEAYQEFDTGKDNVIKATGATGEAAQELIDSYAEVAESVPGDFGTIGSALGEVNTRFGFTGDKLEETTEQFMKFADITGMDAVSAVQKVSRAMGDAGIDSSEYSSVLDELALAAQASGISVDKLTEYLTKYGAPMRALGFDTAEAISIFSQWEKAGVNTEIAFSGMKTAISKWSGEGKNAKEEFQKTLDAIGSAPDIAEATTMAIEAFGKKAGPDLADAIQGGRFEYSDFLGLLESSEGTVENTFEATQNIADKWGLEIQKLRMKSAALADNLLNKYAPQITTAFEKVQDVLDKVFPAIEKGIDWITEHGNEIIGVLSGIVAGIIAFKAVTVIQTAVAAFKSLATVIQLVGIKQAALNLIMSMNPIGLIVAAIAGLVTTFVVLWNKSEKFRNFWIGLWESIQKTLFDFFDNWISGWTSIKEFFSKVWNDFQGIFQIGMDAIVGFFAFAWENIKNGWNSVSAFFTGIGESIQETVWNALDAVVGFFISAKQKAESVWNSVTAFFVSLWNGIKAVFSTIAEWINSNVFEPVKAFFQPVITFFTEAWAIIGELAQGCINLIFAVWTLASEWFNTNVIQPVKEFFTALWNGVKESALTAWENIKNGWTIAGTWFNTNVIQPIKNFFIAFWTAVKDFALTAWENIKNGWKIAGTWFNTNVIQPIKNFFIALWTAVKDFALTAWENIKNGWKIVGTWFNDNVIQPVNNFFTGMWDGVKNGAVQAWDGITQTFAHVADWFGDKFSAAWQRVKDVFSTGGKVFDGIKDGIFSAFKSVVNTLIRGINTIIAVPFNAINNALDTIAGIQILDFQPFAGLISRFSVPEIPQLAKRGIVKKPTIAQIGEAGTEAVIPLERNKAGLKKLADLLKDDIFPKFPKNGSPAGAGGATVVKNYNFNQTNTSPKALSRSEIYRQTKNLIRTLKREDLT